MPSKTDEEWRRTDVSRFNPSQFSKLEHLDGQKLVLPSALPKGVILKPLRQAAKDHPELVEPRLFSLGPADRDRFTALHAAVFADQRAELQKDSTLRLFNVTLGGKFSKTRVEASLAGEGSNAELKAIYFASGDQFFDFHTLQDHRVGNTRSDLLFKGALQDVSRTVYAGLIKIEKHAARSDAYQANRNLVLSDKAKATSIPMLEIDNNDVRCTHGATVGPVDPEHLFYLRSRGIPEATAKRMLIQGFFGDVLDRIPFEHARKLVEAELESRIGRPP